MDAAIRRETPADYSEVENLTREAFWNVYRPGAVEHFLLHRYRALPDFVPELSQVLELDGRIIAHIMYSRAELRRESGSVLPVLVFGPVSVLPGHQKRGYGAALIRHTLAEAAESGFGAVVITGSPDYYRRFGFAEAKTLGVYYDGVPRDEPTPYLLALELQDGYLAGGPWIYRDPPGYDVRDEDVNAFDARFPPKQKLKLPGQLW
ncbi:MAG: N-acetyltransferase [Arthrobacter sp.]